MKHSLLTLATFAATFGLAGSAATQNADFRWSGAIAQGQTLEIRGVNGSIRALASDDGSAYVEASRYGRRDEPTSVRIEVVEHAGGVAVCAVYPTPARSARANECRPGGGQVNVENNDVRVDFVVRVPAGVRFAGHTVNGGIEADGLRSDVSAGTVNGRIEVRTTGFVSRASTVNGDIDLVAPAGLDAELHVSTLNGTIESDFPITVSGRVGPRTMRGTIGRGGHELRVSTVNGNVRLRRN